MGSALLIVFVCKLKTGKLQWFPESVREQALNRLRQKLAELQRGQSANQQFYNWRGAAALGAGGPEFKSRRSDQKYVPYFLQLGKSVLHPKLHSGIPADRRTRSANDSIVKTCSILKIRQQGAQACKFVNH